MGEVKVNGKMYPIRMTMGAMRRFKNETGKDFKDIEKIENEDMCTLMWCCMQSACRADGVDCSDVTKEDFMDGIDLMRLVPLMKNIGLTPAEPSTDDDEKKS